VYFPSTARAARETHSFKIIVEVKSFSAVDKVGAE